MTASRTTPTLCVLVIITGPSRNPESSTQVVPVISPLPFNENQPAKTASIESLPRGRTAVTPVRTGPMPTFKGPSPEIKVVCPTSTPLMSVMALNSPGVPSNGTPKSRALRLVCANKNPDNIHTAKTTRQFRIRFPQKVKTMQYKLRIQFCVLEWVDGERNGKLEESFGGRFGGGKRSHVSHEEARCWHPAGGS